MASDSLSQIVIGKLDKNNFQAWKLMMFFGIVKVLNNAMEPVKQKKKKVDIHFQVEADPDVREIGVGQHAKPTLLSFKMKERKIWTYGWMVVFIHQIQPPLNLHPLG